MGYYRVYKLKTGFKFSYDGKSDIIYDFINWCYDHENMDPHYYVCLDEKDIKRQDIRFIEGA